MTFISSKAIVIIVFMYTSSFMLLAVQYVYADTFGMTLTSPVNGQQLKSNIINYININNINTIQSNVTGTTRTSVISSATSYLSMTWEIMQLMIGGYIFNVLYLLGVPSIFISGFIAIYFIFLIITFIALIRATFF